MTSLGRIFLPLNLMLASAGPALAQTLRYGALANLPYNAGYMAKEDTQAPLDELFCRRAVQSYIWALPALNMYGMKEGPERASGKDYNVLPIWKKRLGVKTPITTPNSGVIYALGYLDL
jgi:hypothetical protein